MILYFNSKIVSDSLIPNKYNSGYFYPIVYPRYENVIYDKEDILIKTIGSYKDIQFSKIYINIEFENIDIVKEKYFIDYIDSLWPNTYKSIKFKRPSTLNNWIFEIENKLNENDKDEPVLVVMNHDHPFLEYNIHVFRDIVSKVFSSDESSFKKILYYSHTSEYLNWVLNNTQSVKYTDLGNYLYKSDALNNWVDSIHIMSFETLLFIWKKIKYKGDYIGRFDWTGVSFSKLGLTAYAYPREFFRHYDGYSHISGCRLSSHLNLLSDMPITFPPNNDTNSIVNFYYQKWIDIYIYTIEYFLINMNIFSNTRDRFIEIISHTLKIFNETYIELDCNQKYFPFSKKEEIVYLLENKVYFNANYIYLELKTNIELRKVPFLIKIINKVKKFKKNVFR
jgi:hypothetical protein